MGEESVGGGVWGVWGSREQAILDVTLETGVSTRRPIAWIELRVDERGRKVDSG